MRKKIAAGIVALVLPFTFAACGSDASEAGFGTNSTQEGGSQGYGEGNLIPDSNYYVKRIEVDGTPCIIFHDGDVGNITCNWNDTNADDTNEYTP